MGVWQADGGLSSNRLELQLLLGLGFLKKSHSWLVLMCDCQKCVNDRHLQCFPQRGKLQWRFRSELLDFCLQESRPERYPEFVERGAKRRKLRSPYLQGPRFRASTGGKTVWVR